MKEHLCCWCGETCSCPAFSTEECWGCAYCDVNGPWDDEEEDDDNEV